MLGTNKMANYISIKGDAVQINSQQAQLKARKNKKMLHFLIGTVTRTSA